MLGSKKFQPDPCTYTNLYQFINLAPNEYVGRIKKCNSRFDVIEIQHSSMPKNKQKLGKLPCPLLVCSHIGCAPNGVVLQFHMKHDETSVGFWVPQEYQACQTTPLTSPYHPTPRIVPNMFPGPTLGKFLAFWLPIVGNKMEYIRLLLSSLLTNHQLPSRNQIWEWNKNHP